MFAMCNLSNAYRPPLFFFFVLARTLGKAGGLGWVWFGFFFNAYSCGSSLRSCCVFASSICMPVARGEKRFWRLAVQVPRTSRSPAEVGKALPAVAETLA